MSTFVWPVGGSGGGGVSVYPSFGAFPATASDGTLVIAADTHILYIYDANLAQWLALSTPGSDITSINSDSTTAQTLTTGTSGTDFNIVDDAAGDHKFNLPVADATHTGKLSSADWSTFNGKQNALGYTPVNKAGDTMSGALAFSGAGTAVQLDAAQAAQPAYAEGKVFYDPVEKSLAYYNDVNGVTVNVGQETLLRVHNNTGSTILNGKAVYINGATGDKPTIALAKADAELTSKCIGVVTADIAHGTQGYVTLRGIIHDLNTNSYNEGDSLFLSKDTAGELVNVAPTAPNYRVFVGYVTRKNSSNGTILVNVDRQAYIQQLIGDVTADGRGDGSVTATVTAINGTALSGLATGILKNTTGTGVPSIAVAGDFPTLNQNTSGTAAGLSSTLVIGSGGTGATTAATALQNLGGETVFNGLEDPTKFAISYSAANRQFTITYTGTAAYTVNGVRYTKTGSDVTTAHANTTGLWFCYYDASGVLTVASTAWDLLTQCPIAAAYYTTSNAGGAAAGILIDERHPGVGGMDNAVHKNLHLTRGTQLVSGIAISGYTLAGTTLAAVTYGTTAGTLHDEDLIVTAAAITDADGAGTPYRVFYKTGSAASPSWNWVDSALPYHTNGTDPYYNQNNAGTYQLTAVTVNNRWINYWVLGTTAASAPQTVVIMGENVYTSLALAQAASFSTDVKNITDLTTEGVVVYRTVLRRIGNATTKNGTFEAVDTITQSIVGTTSTGAITAASVGTDVTNFDNLIAPSDTTVQKALDRIDDHTHAARQKNYIKDGAFIFPTADAQALTGWTQYKNYDPKTVTITNASPAVFTTTAHGYYVGLGIKFTTTGSLPTGLTAGTQYYVSAVPTVDTYRVSATVGGADINTSSAGSGTHTGTPTPQTIPLVTPLGTPDAALTFLSTTTTPLMGTYSALLTHTAADLNGNSWRYAFTLDRNDLARVIAISFDYEVASGTFADGDVTVWISDGTNVIQPAPYQITNGTGPQRFLAEFQTSASATSYQLILHCPNTTATAFTLKLDNIVVAARAKVFGAPVTDWQSYSPSFGGANVFNSITAQWRRVGDSIEITGSAIYHSGTDNIAISLPSGVSVDSTKAVGSLGIGSADDNSATLTYPGIVTYAGSNLLRLDDNTVAGRRWSCGSNRPFTWQADADTLAFHAIVGVSGWSSSTQMSDSTDTRVVSLRYGDSSNQSTSSTYLAFATKDWDTHGFGSADGSGFLATVPSSGWYEVTVNLLASGNVSNGLGSYLIRVYKNEVLDTSISAGMSASGSQQPAIGGTLKVYADSGTRLRVAVTKNGSAVDFSLIANATFNKITITKVQGPSQIAASESVSMRYTSTATTAINAKTDLTYGTKDWDSHGAFDGTSFTAPVSGEYLVRGSWITATVNLSATNQWAYVHILKEGSVVMSKLVPGQGANTNHNPEIVGTVKLLAGQKVRLQGECSVATSMANLPAYSYIEIKRVGNY